MQNKNLIWFPEEKNQKRNVWGKHGIPDSTAAFRSLGGAAALAPGGVFLEAFGAAATFDFAFALAFALAFGGSGFSSTSERFRFGAM